MEYAALPLKPKFLVVFFCLLPAVIFFTSQDFNSLGSWKELPWKWRNYASLADLPRMVSVEENVACLSRSYQDKKLGPPTKELLSVWQRYLKLHAGCSSHKKNWTELLAGDGTNVTTEDPCKYVVYVEHSIGLGNRILSLVSAFTYALLTNRVLMVDTRQTLSTILCEPFETSWLLPDSFPYSVLDTAPALGEAIDKKFQGLKVVHLKLFHIQSGGDKSFFCNEYQEQLEKIQFLLWSSNQYYITSLFQIPMFWEKLLLLFRWNEELDIFAQMARLVISPVNDVWKLISGFHGSYLSCSSKLVGVQIRPHGRPDINAFDTTVNQVLQDCLMNNGLVPRVDNNTAPSLEFHKQNSVSIFVAALQGRYRESLRDLYLSGGTPDDQSVSVHSLSHEGWEQHSLHQDQLALADMWLLSMAEKLVASGYSTFGYIAHGISGTKPFYMKYEKDNETCVWSKSSQPCTHFPQVPSCPSGTNLTSEHGNWIQQHVQTCVDTHGLQLVN